GLIREDFDPVRIAKNYQPYAASISVLTDEKYFQGSYDFLTMVSNAVHQPVLCKDFIIDAYQVYLARYYQADAILLMLSVLDDETYREL
ncbi:bifunctional indole-3-glycerol phosphate synthase/phosphoribosylanthranilate isomerase, partial [Xenorhabdus bovienii]|nr:bifunctional indole-3-glycerol phosphate synthase/phosphoribosylanthranilate isomerase [Xenorhabdus bovienii]